MILNRRKATKLLFKLDVYCRQRHIGLPKDRNARLIALAKIVIGRYHGIVLVDDSGKYLCNNPKYLRKWVLHKSFHKGNPIITPHCDKFVKYNSI